MFHPGDSYETAPDGVDVLALPLSAPWAKVSETVDFVQRVSPTTLFPIHDRTISDLAYGIYWGQVAELRRRRRRPQAGSGRRHHGVIPGLRHSTESVN